MQGVVPLLTLVGFALLLWFLLIRPQTRRNRELASMQATLEVGDEVMLTSGVFGVVRAVTDSDVRVEVADGVTIRVARGAIGQVVTPNPESADEGDAGPDDSEVSEEN